MSAHIAENRRARYVYALGATLYALLTGGMPPEAPDLSSGADALRPPRQVNPAISETTSGAEVRSGHVHVSHR